jgi:hypothetical protein
MWINDATRDFLGWAIAAAAIAGAIVLTSIQPGHAANDIYATFKDSGSIVSGEPIVTLRVPGGLYAIFGKINIDQDDTTEWVTVVCTLRAALDIDRDVSRLQRSGAAEIDNATIRLQLVTVLDFDDTNAIELSCKFETAESSLLSFRFAKITAIRLDGNRCSKPSPADCMSF